MRSSLKFPKNEHSPNRSVYLGRAQLEISLPASVRRLRQTLAPERGGIAGVLRHAHANDALRKRLRHDGGPLLGFQVGTSAGDATDLEQRYAYSADGRFDTLTTKRASNSVTHAFDYAYFTNTPFVSALSITTSGNSFTLTRDYETNRNLLKTIEGKWNSSSITRYEYTHDARSQRTTAKQSGSAYADYYATGYSAVFNHYVYNAKGELETAAMYRGDTPSTTPSSGDELPGRRFEYRFDSIGNRKTDGPTGDATNVDDQYVTNALNQYTAKENNTVRLLGTVASNANVGIAGATSSAKRDRAWGADLVPANTTTASKGTANVYAAVPGTGGAADAIRQETKSFFVPKALQTFTYDDDGNLTADSVWDYAYDAENRLTSMQHRTEVIGTGMVATSDARRYEFKYDHQGRRVRKTSYGGWNGTTYSATPLSDTKFLYDGWHLIAEFNVGTGGTLTLAKSYTWGLDLTGSLTASGGVGALVQIFDATVTGGKTLLPTYDGNGNVAALLNAADGALEAAYEYDPFGNLLRCEGTYAASNTFRFSTKFQDTATGLLYYGLRYYSPSLGRFVCRDPLEESGGINLYAFIRNNAINGWDYLGMFGFFACGWGEAWADFGAGRPNSSRWGEAPVPTDATVPLISYADAVWNFGTGVRGGETVNVISLPGGPTVAVLTDANVGNLGQQTVFQTGSVSQGGVTLATASDQIIYQGAVDRDTGQWLNLTGNTSLPAPTNVPNSGTRDSDVGPDGVRYVGPMLTDSDRVGTAIDVAGNAAAVAGLVADAGGDLRHNTYFWRQANGTWRARNAASEANYLLNRSYTLAEARTAIWKTASTRIGVAGLIISIADIGHNGLNWRNGADLAFGLIGFAGPIGTAISSTYTVATLSWDIYHAANPAPRIPIRDPDE